MDDISTIFSQFTFISAIDILLVTLIFYGVLRLFEGTQGVQLLRGVIVVIILGALIINFTQLTAFKWLINSSGVAILVALPVIFQPELRRMLERIGRTGTLFITGNKTNTDESLLISELVSTCTTLSKLQYGAIIALEGMTGLGEFIENGVQLESSVKSELLVSIFYPKTPLHDGAVILRENRMVAARCVLPLTDKPLHDPNMGTRHRAAIGLTEHSDALSLIVSEESGNISAAQNGNLIHLANEKLLRRVLENFYQRKGVRFGGPTDALEGVTDA